MNVNAPPDAGLAATLAKLPEILEIKTTLDGLETQFRCRVLARTGAAVGDALSVLFVSDRPYQVAELTLPPGTVTFGHFWRDRPYNVYHWMTPAGATIAHYFNLASDTRIAEEVLRWRDLAVDVLVRPGAPPELLDEAELPEPLDRDLLMTLAEAQRAVLTEADVRIAELEAQADRTWARLWGRPRQRALP